MLSTYEALAFFVAFAMFIPASYLLTSKMLHARAARNSVKNAPFESGEESIPGRRDIQTEYLPYFALFLPFEVVVAVLFIWAYASKSVPSNASLAIVLLAAVSCAAALAGYRIAGGRRG